MNSDQIFDEALIARYNLSGPRYTSYPTAVQFHDGFGEQDYLRQVADTNAKGGPLSIYVHIPFCNTVCYFCACNKIITANRKRAVPYLADLFKEIELQGGLFDRSRPVDQLHWGGGTPTYIDRDQRAKLWAMLAENFNLHDDDSGEYSIEIDPREIDPEGIRELRDLGFNRISFGVQDIDPAVQKAVNRIQPWELTQEIFYAARDAGFHSISLDLIYGLSHQTQASFSATLAEVIKLSPDRLSVFNYAHMPQMFKVQKQIKDADLPSAAEKLAILKSSTEQLLEAGYRYIGMDHFAKPDDELALAQDNGTLYRNFQGYSTHAECDLVAMGNTGIGMVGRSYSQNEKGLEDYHQRIERGEVPLFRGVELTDDDLLRRDVITQLICNFSLNFAAVSAKHQIEFGDYFADELKALKVMQQDGLLDLDNSSIQVRPGGRLLIRNICMVFDRYLPKATEQRFSKVI